MRYLFFDIECSDGTHIMSFGYVLTDSSFNILEKKDILMNPEAVFHTGAWGKKNRETEPGVKMAYPKEVFLSKPTFPYFYDEIKSVITAPDQLVVGFSHKNDTTFLDKACNRYNLPSIDYDFYDVQVMHKEMNGLANPVSTETLAAEYNLDVANLVAHRSDDDSEVSMLVTKILCRNRGVNLPDLIKEFPNSCGRHYSYKTVYVCKTRAESLIKFINGNTTTGNNQMKHANLTKFFTFIDEIAVTDKTEAIYKGESFSFARNYFDNHFREMIMIIQGVIDRGGAFARYPVDASVFVYDEANVSDEKKYVDNLIKKGKTIKTMTINELLKELKLSDEALSHMLFVNKKN